MYTTNQSILFSIAPLTSIFFKKSFSNHKFGTHEKVTIKNPKLKTNLRSRSTYF